MRREAEDFSEQRRVAPPSCGVRDEETIYIRTILRQSGWNYFLVNVRPEIVFFSLGASDASAARFKT